MHTDASSGPLTPYTGPLPPKMYGASARDDGLSRLDADGYLLFRVGDQLNYFHPKVVQLSPPASRVQPSRFRSVPQERSLRRQVSKRGSGYHGHRGSGRRISRIPPGGADARCVQPGRGETREPATAVGAQPAESRDFDWLVSEAEGVLATELSGWVQQMNQAVEEAARRGETSAEGAAGRDGGSWRRVALVTRATRAPPGTARMCSSRMRARTRSSSSST